ncbi:MAG: amino acid adenylation domain-containing protein [Myxococcales bacterium]|nr:amino acid adenylation domain-containing protein [Myxococcales bacterium]
MHAGSLYRFLLPPGGELLDAHLLLRGVYTWENRSCFVSEAHSAGDLDSIVDAVRSSFVEMRAAGWWTGRAAHQSDASPGATPVVGGSARADDPRAPETEVVSPGQARLYFLHKTLERSETYVLSDAFLVEQHIDHERLRRALSVVIGRHEQLRACFYEREGAPHQRIIDDLPPPLEVIDLRELPYDERRAAFARRHEGMIRSPFDLTRAPPWRMLVAQLDADVSAVALAWHHITSDGESFALLLDELSRAYLEPKAGDEPDATPAPSYSAYARRVRAWLAAPEAEAARRWWSDYLADASGLAISPPSAEPRRSDKGRVTFDLDADAVEGVKASARAVGCTPFVLFLAAWSLALGRQTGQSEFVVGVVSDGRDEPELRGAIGFFVNTLPLRVRIPEAPSLCSWISTLRDGLRDVLERGRLPLDEIVRLAPRGRATASDLLRACISLDEADCETFAGAPITRLEETQTATGAPKFDLLLNLSRTRSGYRVALDYAPEVIDARAAQELASRVQIALASLCDDLQRPIAAVDLLTDEERERLLVGWNRAVPRSLHAGLIHAQFSALADARPERAGIVFREETWTYGQLDRHARALAQIIAPHISKAEARVAIYMERSPAAVVAILAILRCGGAFVPIDPAYPAARVRRMFAAAAIELVLSDRPHDTPAEVPVLDVRAPAWTSAAPEAPPVAAALHPLNLAYIIFTSGTTGRPKGILMTHESVMTRVDRTQRLHQLGADDRVLQNGNLSFDLFIWEIFIPLLTGATVIMSDPRRLGDFEDLAALVEREQITVARFVPAVLRLLFENARLGPWTSLRRVITGGEALSVPLMRRFLDAFPHVALYNQLGPSERPSSISWRCSPDPELRSVPIGAPLAETRVYLLDAQLRLVPPGAIGELFVGGVGLARGYLDDSRQTAASFLPDPFAEHPGARMYRTGDLARFRDDGQLVFVGRADFQVKIRGQRIELGEIERCLLSAEGVRGAVVVARTSAGGEAELVAYVAADATVEPRSLRAHARSELPLYMVPSQVVVLDALPLSENGKVDRRALPDPPAEAGTDERAYLAPRTALEQTLVDVWQATLGLARVGIGDNFFDLGGHSLLAMKLAWSVYEATGKEVRLAALFRAPTVAALAALLTEQEDGPRLVAHGPQRRVPAAPVQRGLWLHDQASRARAAYNVSWALRLRGHVDGDLLAAAFTEVVRRHAPLRTTFHALEDGLVQRIHDEPMATLRVLDLRDAPPPRDALQRRATRLFMTPLDLERAPPYRAELLRVADEEHLLLLTVHHIVADGWSFGVLFQELSRAYARRLDHRADAPAPLPVQYSDYTLWCHTRLSSAAGSADREYWLETLSDPPPPIELPCRRMTPTDERAGEQLDVPMAPEVVAGLRALGKAAHASLHPVLLTLMRTLLFRYTAQRDSIIGVFSSGRAHPMLAGLIGHFVNTLALRGELDPHQTFVEAVIAERDRLTAAYAHELYPFEWVVRDARATRRSGHVPLLDVVLVFDDREPGLPELPGVEVESLDFEAAVASDQLVLSFQATDADVHCRLTFNRHAFEREAVARMWSHLEALARAAVAFPSAPLDALDFLPERERRRLLEDFLARQPAAAPSTTLLDRFAAQVARTPENLAVTSSTGEGALTYRELDDQSRALASALARRGVTRDTPVAVLCERAPSYVVCILAVLKAGGAYVPIDPEHPRARLVDAIERAGVTLLLAPGSTSESVVDLGCEVLTMKDAAAAARDVALHSPLPGSLAYIIFTSGSSGRPKGVAITHANVVDFLDSVAFLDNGPAHALLQLMPLIFDVSTVDIWMSLTTGTRLVMFAPSVPTLDELERVVERFAITTMVPSTGLLHTIIDERPALLANMRQVLTGGDVLSPSHVARALPKLPGIMANGYGPTECTVGTSMYVMRPGDVVPPRIPIGAPFASSRVYIVDAALRLVPIGVPGELCIGGPGIARGYVGAPGMTAALFCPDPFGAPGSRMYRTGDRARYLEDGTLDFLGRLDEQVKVRGHRIELAEVQETLTRHPKVRQAAVLTHFLGTSKRLAAFVVADAPLSAGDLQGFASASLPEYMIPNDIFVLERMPHTSNGKIDRRALYGHLAAARSTERVPPATPHEARLLEIVSELLEHTELGVCDDLFDRGLDSLLAIRLVAQVSERLGFDLPVAQVFATPQIRALAAACEDRSAVHRMVLSEGSGPPLYIMPSIFGYASAFTTMTRHLREIASVGLELRVDVDPVADLQELLRHPIEEEPCVLLGYSAGGNLAFHVATTLPSDRLRAVILLDTSARQAADVREGPALDRAVAEAVRALMNTVSPDAQGSSDVRDALTPKLQALLRYHLRSYDKGCIEADLHVIVAADDDDAPSEARFAELRQGWRRCTRGAVSLHQGSGTHYEMLTQPHAARNAAIVQQIIDDLRVRS